MLTCLICGGDMNQDTAEVTELLRAHGCVSTTRSTEGRVFLFANGEELEVGGMCSACDEKEIRRYLRQASSGDAVPPTTPSPARKPSTKGTLSRPKKA
ncbi:MAG TPA: hypothetical protein VGO53_07735 [Steroidobacteraceae bacterium]|jgi:hypothetical protein|nr:hypothetical protein [Steroidobacteraceae bacterium]